MGIEGKEEVYALEKRRRKMVPEAESDNKELRERDKMVLEAELEKKKSGNKSLRLWYPIFFFF